MELCKASYKMKSQEQLYLLSNTRTKLAKLYGVAPATFRKWIEKNTQLKKLMKQYKGTNSLPPDAIRMVITCLGEP